MATVNVRYIVHDVDAAIDFYCQHLGFHEVMHLAPPFARSCSRVRPETPGALRAHRPRPASTAGMKA